LEQNNNNDSKAQDYEGLDKLTSAATTNVSGPKPMLKQNMKAQRTTSVGTALHSK